MRRVATVSQNKRDELVGSRTEVLDAICEVLDHCVGVKEYKPDDGYAKTYDLVARNVELSDALKSDTNRVRVCKYRVNVQGVIGVLTHLIIKEMACAAVHGMNTRLQSTQRNGDWAAIAYEITTKVRKKSGRMLNNVAAADYSVFSGKPSPPKMIATSMEQEQFIVSIVFIDVLNQPNIDTWSEHTGMPGPFANNNTPRQVQLQMKEGMRIVKDFQLENTYIDNGRDLKAAIKELKKQGISWKMSDAEKALNLVEREDHEPEKMTSKQVSSAIKMRAASIPWRDIAALVGVDWRTVKHHVDSYTESNETDPTVMNGFSEEPAVLE